MAENNENVSLSIESSSQKSGVDAVYMAEMIKKLLEKQNEQDKTNKEIIENQQKLLDEFRLIRNEQNGRKRDLVDKDNSIENAPKRVDLDTSAVDEGSLTENKSMIPTCEKTGKCFTMKHTFKNVFKLENVTHVRSEQQEHFGIIWGMFILRNNEHIAVYTWCRNEKPKGIWSIEADCEVKMKSKNGTPDVRKTCNALKSDSPEEIRNVYYWARPDFEKWDVLKQELSTDDSLTFEVSFNIKKMAGIYKDNLRCFDDPECSDVVLIVQDKKFHVLKLYLATHSSYFKAMFLGMFGESKKSEIKLDGIDADDFQKYLEVLYGDYSIDEYTVEGILMVSDMFDTQIVIKKCQEFLMKESNKTLKKKLEISVRYNLENLKKKCLSEIKTMDDIRRVLPDDISDLDHSIMAELLKKALF